MQSCKKLKQSFLGVNIDATGFPFARFYLAGMKDELIDDAPTYKRVFTFHIEIFQEISNKAKPTAEADWEDAIEEVMTTLSENWSLPKTSVPTVINSTIQQGGVQQVEPPFGPAILMRIVFTAEVVVN